MAHKKIDPALIVDAFGPKFLTEEQLVRIRDGQGDVVEILRSALRQFKINDRTRSWKSVLGKWVLSPASVRSEDMAPARGRDGNGDFEKSTR